MNEDSRNETVLTSIYQTTRTAINSIDDILPSIKDEGLVSEISKQSSNYSIIQEECEMLARAEDFDIKDINWFERIRLWSSIKVSTFMDDSTSAISESLLLGTFMGYISCLKDLKQEGLVDDEIMSLSKKLMELTENNIESLKNFL